MKLNKCSISHGSTNKNIWATMLPLSTALGFPIPRFYNIGWSPGNILVSTLLMISH
jgi:hypothetical protein